MMKIAIIGTRGIPNHYGGFEQFAEYVSVGLVKMGCEVSVYNSHNHPFQRAEYKGVKIIHCKDPEHKFGTIGQFIYDLNCIRDSRKRKYDIILQLGYTSSSIWHWLLPKKSIVITNMDGIEWKRTKFSSKVQRFLKYAEKLAVNNSDYLIADSVGIQEHIKSSYNKDSIYIPYGAFLKNETDDNDLSEYNLIKHEYNMLVARLEPENSIEVILDGCVLSKTNIPFLVVGKIDTKFGQHLVEKYKKNKNILFAGGIYDQEKLSNLRACSNIYFHGHTVGGTNPSLLEAMGDGCFIIANDNIFNKSILSKDALYFENVEQVAKIIMDNNRNDFGDFISNNQEKIRTIYSWETIIQKYHSHFLNICK